LAWYRRLIARKFDGSKHRCYPGRPRSDVVIEALVVRMAGENSSCGHDRIVGALANLGHHISDQTIETLKRFGMVPAHNTVDDTSGAVRRCRYLLHDCDAEFCTALRRRAGVKKYSRFATSTPDS
jgi:hypothetical protein